MLERRKHRSGRKDEALGLLLESVLARSKASAIAVVDARGLVVSGRGSDREQAVLGAVAESASRGVLTSTLERLTDGTDVMSRRVDTARGTLYLAALGERVSRMNDAARAVERIVAHVA